MKRNHRFFTDFFVPGFSITFGIVLIIIGVVRVVHTESFVGRAGKTTATVLTSHQGMLIWSAAITIGFTDNTGVKRKAEFETGGETTRYERGDSVNILYDPVDTSTVYVGNPRLRRHPVSGVFFLLGGGLIWVTIRRLREGTDWR